jgi:hypothetical protein
MELRMFAMFKRKPDTKSELASWQEEVEEKNKYTPDVPHLFTKWTWLLFVCDEMKRDHRNAIMLSDVFGPAIRLPLAPAFTKPEFSMWKKKLGKESYPVPLQGITEGPGPHKITSAKLTNMKPKDKVDIPQRSIRGELYVVTPERILKLDKYKENTVVFARKQVEILVPHIYTVRNSYATSIQKYSCTTLPAWMYVGINSYWEDHIDGGFQFSLVNTDQQESLTSYGLYDFIDNPYYNFTSDQYTDD